MELVTLADVEQLGEIAEQVGNEASSCLIRQPLLKRRNQAILLTRPKFTFDDGQSYLQKAYYSKVSKVVEYLVNLTLRANL